MLAAGLVVGFGNKVSLPGFGKASIEGATLVFVHEKLTPPMDEVLLVRDAPAFVAVNKLAGFLDVDDDEPFAEPLLAKAKDKKPPFVAIAKVDKAAGTVNVIKVVPWPKSLEDLK
jgi:hypothetical protein